MHYHNGDKETALQLMQKNQKLFKQLDADHIIYSATGCGSFLQEYHRIITEETDQSTQLDDDSFRVSDINTFVVQNWPEKLSVKANHSKVLVHEPCSQRNILKNQQSVYQLLDKIPELQVSELADNHLCCGSAGTYVLSHSKNAHQLRDAKIASINNQQADYLLTSNLGCAMHISAADDFPNHLKVVHPMVLLAACVEG